MQQKKIRHINNNIRYKSDKVNISSSSWVKK